MQYYFLNILRYIFKTIFKSHYKHEFDKTGEASSDFIYNMLNSKKPFLIARIGATEFKCVSAYVNERKGAKKYIDYIFNKTDSLEVNDDIINQANMWSGIFPKSRSIINQFSALTLNDFKDIDVIGLWLKEEYIFKKELSYMTKIPLADIEPYYHKNPWSRALANKKVLVIHPFEESIISQYSKRSGIFYNQDILPGFELKTLKAVQTIAGQNSQFSDWFDALDYMKNKMNEIDYDIAIIGCGAYGLPLGVHAKKMGKQAIHLGGATQILFGIKGARWDDHPIISKLYNENWIRPNPSETPKKKDKVEEGCYW